MKWRTVLVAVLAGSAVAFSAVDHRQLKDGAPVEKVVALLEDLEATVKADGEHEQKMYDKFACWCESTTARKAKAIEDATASLRRLGDDILSLKGKVATHIAEIEKLRKDIRENEETQEEATSIRQKENQEYMEESADLQQALVALAKAVKVLADATQKKSSLIQASRQAEAAQRVKDVVAAIPVRAMAAMKSDKLILLRTFAEGKSQYAPQSGNIQGILRDMYDRFTTDLEELITVEADKNTKFEDLMATLQEELKTLKDTLGKKETAKAEAEVMLSEATQAYDDTQGQMGADVEFFDATKQTCTDNSDAWKKRKEVREAELEAIKKCLEVLTSPEAKKTFDKAIKPGIETGAPTLLQVAKQMNSDKARLPAKKAYEALRKAAKKGHSLRLARLAAQVHMAKAGHFDAVIEEIDKIIADLQQEQLDDTMKRDVCKKEYQDIESKVKDLEWKIEVNERTIKKLEDEKEAAEDELEKTEEEITKTEEDIKEMKKTRTEENTEFLNAKKDDEDAIVLLEEAKQIMKDFYKNHSIAVGQIQGEKKESAELLQQGPEFTKSNDTAPEFKLTDKGHRRTEGKGVLSLLELIIQDLHDEISNAKAEEKKAQLEFEELIAKAEKYLEEMQEKKTNLETTIARLIKEKGEEETKKTENEADKKEQEDYKKDITDQCDFFIDKYEERMTKRTAEMKGLTEAKEFLVGYQEDHEGGVVEAPGTEVLLQGQKPAALLQSYLAMPRSGAGQGFGDGALSRIDFARVSSSSFLRR